MHIMSEPPVKFRYLQYISVYSIRATLSKIIKFVVGNFPTNLKLFSSPVCEYQDFVSQ